MIVYADSIRVGQCRSCGAAINWATNVQTDRAIPFDTIVLEELLLQPDPQIARIDMARSVSHFATCPHAEAWRRRLAK